MTREHTPLDTTALIRAIPPERRQACVERWTEACVALLLEHAHFTSPEERRKVVDIHDAMRTGDRERVQKHASAFAFASASASAFAYAYAYTSASAFAYAYAYASAYVFAYASAIKAGVPAPVLDAVSVMLLA